jgi:hypothetical protein
MPPEQAAGKSDQIGVRSDVYALGAILSFTNHSDIIAAAGVSIPEGSNAAIQVELLVGSPTNQTVKVQARGFTNDVPITLAIVPENRPSSNYKAVIPITGNPSSLTLNVVIPDGTVSRIQARRR